MHGRRLYETKLLEDDEPVLENPKRVNRFDPAKRNNRELLLKLKMLEGSNVTWEKDQHCEVTTTDVRASTQYAVLTVTGGDAYVRVKKLVFVMIQDI